jgi:hypothetical protein
MTEQIGASPHICESTNGLEVCGQITLTQAEFDASPIPGIKHKTAIKEGLKPVMLWSQAAMRQLENASNDTPTPPALRIKYFRIPPGMT